MPSIFDDERRGCGAKSPDRFAAGRIFARAASRAACVGPATRRHPLLTPLWDDGAKIRSRHGRHLNLNRP